MQGIYWWINAINGKAYVGSAKNIDKRKKVHLRNLEKGKHHSLYFQRSWNKYGADAFEFEALEIVEDEIWLRARETVWLKRLETYRANQIEKRKANWTPDRRAAQAERLRQQKLNNPIMSRRKEETDANWKGEQ